MSSGMFRGKDFSNRIELSQLVQDFSDLGLPAVPCGSGEGADWLGASGGHGGCP